MDENAQQEIQKLCEAREKSSSNENVRRNWDVVGLVERPRRKISQEGQRWWKKKERVEWVLVLRGETGDCRSRVTPVKHEDPWKPRPVVVSQPQQIVCPAHGQGIGNMVRRVPEKKQMSVEEAEVKMGEMLGDLLNVGE
jgi:hypothetical protein